MKLIRKNDVKKCDNSYDDLLDGLTTLSDLDYAKRTLSHLSNEELRSFEWSVNNAVNNAKKLLPLIKKQIQQGK